MPKLLFEDKTTVKVRALFIGERLDLKVLENTNCLATSPLVVTAGEHGYAVLFRYGVIVLFGLTPLEEVSFLKHLEPLIIEPIINPEVEEEEVLIDPVEAERVENGVIFLRDSSIERIQIVADILAKSVVLARYEVGTASAFDQIEPFAVGLQRTAKDIRRQGKELLRQLGSALLIQHKMVGRVEIIDKPELLWEAPELERFFLRLEDEYEIRERHVALERKLGLVSRTAETVLELMQHNTSLRVEWYVVILIVVEILLSLYKMIF